jgi:hypothetical protein
MISISFYDEATMRPFTKILILALLTVVFRAIVCMGAGVTVITHGFNSSVSGWITGMADRESRYPTFPGTDFTTYTILLTTDGTSYFYSWSRTNASPAVTDSGEIIVKLDWSQMAGGSAPYDISTYEVARIASVVLLQTNAISDMGGHALAELPLHLIGHSRGGSLVSELTRQLGTNGVWVDHVTTLDPHPLNNDGNFEPLFPTDAPAKNTYVNVLFADNYWQNFTGGFFDFDGEAVSGAYNRHLTSLGGGYNNTSSAAPYHSNVHLWYHGTIHWTTPASDTEASITTSERASWWAAYEQAGTNAGFEYSLIGGASRLSTDKPLGAGFPAIRDGFNQWWDFGAGNATNRTPLPSNNGNWPGLIKLNRTETNFVMQGQSIAVKLYYQWARPATTNGTITFYLDDDLNAFNGNEKMLLQLPVSGSGAALNLGIYSVPLYATNAAPGWHSIFAVINGAGHTRYLYAPERVQVLPSQQPPNMDIARIGPLQFRVGINALAGQTVILQTSPDLTPWQAIATNTLANTNRWLFTNNPPSGTGKLFYRSVLAN